MSFGADIDEQIRELNEHLVEQLKLMATPRWMVPKQRTYSLEPYTTPAPVTEPETDDDDSTDRITRALVAGSIPKYRNSEYCAKCGAQRVFIKMDFVCREHG